MLILHHVSGAIAAMQQIVYKQLTNGNGQMSQRTLTVTLSLAPYGKQKKWQQSTEIMNTLGGFWIQGKFNFGWLAVSRPTWFILVFTRIIRMCLHKDQTTKTTDSAWTIITGIIMSSFCLLIFVTSMFSEKCNLHVFSRKSNSSNSVVFAVTKNSDSVCLAVVEHSHSIVFAVSESSDSAFFFCEWLQILKQWDCQLPLKATFSLLAATY